MGNVRIERQVKFNKLPLIPPMLSKLITLHLEDTLDEAVSILEREVPVDTGDLRSTSRYEPVNPLEFVLISGSTEPGPTHGKPVDYGIHVNYGTVHQAANPYMERTAQESSPVFVEHMVEALVEAIKV